MKIPLFFIKLAINNGFRNLERIGESKQNAFVHFSLTGAFTDKL